MLRVLQQAGQSSIVARLVLSVDQEREAFVEAQGTHLGVALPSLPSVGHVGETQLVQFVDGWFK